MFENTPFFEGGNKVPPEMESREGRPVNKVVILYNIATEVKRGAVEDLKCEEEIKIILPLVVDLLRARGYEVEALETTMALWENLKTRKGTFDIVFNLAEAFGGGNKDAVLVPYMLEALGIPCTGASPHAMALTLDKEKTKLVVEHYGVPVAKHQIFRTGDEVLDPNLEFPLIIKPIREEASIGIQSSSVVRDEAALRIKVAEVIEKYAQPAMAEQFIVGREISVGIIGNGTDLHVFPPLEFLFEGSDTPLEEIRSYDYKWGGKTEQMVEADLPDEVKKRLIEYTKIAFIATECTDYARMDFRVAEDGSIYLLEVNSDPGIGPNTHGLNNTLTKMASFEGIEFEDLVERILLTAAKRNGFDV